MGSHINTEDFLGEIRRQHLVFALAKFTITQEEKVEDVQVYLSTSDKLTEKLIAAIKKSSGFWQPSDSTGKMLANKLYFSPSLTP